MRVFLMTFLFLTGCAEHRPIHKTIYRVESIKIISMQKPYDECRLVGRAGTVEEFGIWECAPR